MGSFPETYIDQEKLAQVPGGELKQKETLKCAKLGGKETLQFALGLHLTRKT